MINDINNTLNLTHYTEIEYIEIITKETSLAILITLVLLFIIGIFSNVISILAILSSNKKLDIIKILILNLESADIVYLTGIPFFAINALSSSWPFGLIGCRIFYLIDYIGMTVGGYSIAALSFERLLFVTNKKTAVKLSKKCKKTIAFVYITIIWLMSILFSLPLLNHIELRKFGDYIYSCELNINETKHEIILILRFVLIFLIPFIIILVCSIKLIIFIKKKPSINTIVIKNTNITEQNGSRVLITIKQPNPKQRKSIKIVLSIVFMFAVQWLPYRISIYIYI